MPSDYYEILQISPNADQETVRRIYKIQAQRFHPDNLESGDAEAIHASGESSAQDSAEQQQNDSRFNREPRSARVEDPRRNARFQRPQRRSGARA